MISSTLGASRRWFRRNRTNFAIGAGVLGAGYLAGQYVLGKLNEARVRMSEDRIARENLRRRFEQNQEDCTFTVLAILPTATEEILEAIPVEQVLEELQKHKAERLARSTGSLAPSSEFGGASSVGAPSITVTDEDSKSFVSESYMHASQADGMSGSGSGNGEGEGTEGSKKQKKTKAQLWNEMKIQSITRAFTLLYTLSLLTLLTRIQLNLLGRRNYLASVVSLATPQPTHESRIHLENHDDDNDAHAYGNDFETNRRYLSFSWWLLHRGCLTLLATVQSAVEEVFGSLNPREEITLKKLSELTLEVRKRVEGKTEEERRAGGKMWLGYLLPRREDEAHVLEQSGMEEPTLPPSPSLRRLLDETSDLIESPSFTHVLTLLLDASFSHLIDNKITQLAYKIPPTTTSIAPDSQNPFDSGSGRITDITELEERLDKKTKVANCLAVFCRQAAQIGSGRDNEYLAAVEGVAQLEAFAAVVYSSNFEFERADGEGDVVAETQTGEKGRGSGPATNAGQPGGAPTYAEVAKQEDGAGSASAGASGVHVSLPGTESNADVVKEGPTESSQEGERINVVDGEGRGDEVITDEKVVQELESGFESAWKKAEDVARVGGEVV